MPPSSFVKLVSYPNLVVTITLDRVDVVQWEYLQKQSRDGSHIHRYKYNYNYEYKYEYEYKNKHKYQGLLDKRLMALRISCWDAVSMCSSLNLNQDFENNI